MDKKRVGQIKEQFDLVMHNDETAKVEFWFARELMPLLGYERWENFDKAISRAMESCETSGIEISDHFREVTKMIETGKGAHRPVRDYMLTRYACCVNPKSAFRKTSMSVVSMMPGLVVFVLRVIRLCSAVTLQWK